MGELIKEIKFQEYDTSPNGSDYEWENNTSPNLYIPIKIDVIEKINTPTAFLKGCGIELIDYNTPGHHALSSGLFVKRNVKFPFVVAINYKQFSENFDRKINVFDKAVKWCTEYCEGSWKLAVDNKYDSISFINESDAVLFRLTIDRNEDEI